MDEIDFFDYCEIGGPKPPESLHRNSDPSWHYFEAVHFAGKQPDLAPHGGAFLWGVS